MKKIFLATAAALVLAGSAFAATPNRTTMGFKDFVEASGCTFVTASDGTTINAQGPNGGGCLAIAAYSAPGSRLVDPDGIAGNGDEYTVQDN